MDHPNDVDELLRQTTLVVRRGPYALGAWLPTQISAVYAGLLRAQNCDFHVALLDEREATALILEKYLFELPPARRIEKGWAVVTLDVDLAWDVVGVLAAISAHLAAAGVPTGALAAFSRDHFLIRGDRLDEALAALEAVCGDVVHRD